MMNISRTRGFSTIEMIVAIAIMGVVTATLITMIIGMYQSYSDQYQYADQDAQARLALERVLRDLRDVRAPADLSAPGTSITFTNTSAASVSYALVGNQLQRNGALLAQGVSALTFSYYGDNGAVLASAPGTRYIAAQFTLTTADGIANTVRGVVFPRNFP